MHFGIIGTGRSGTTLLCNLFNTHPEFYVFNETHWIPKMFEFYGTGKAPVTALLDIVRRTYHITGLPVTPLDDLPVASAFAGQSRMTVAAFCNALGMVLAQQHGKARWADKTPDYGPCLQMLQTLWPQCRFVHMVRHGLEVALSMSRHPGFRWMASSREMWWYPASFNGYYQVVETTDCPFAEFIDLWYTRLLRIRNEATRLQPGSYLEVRFEDLLAEPEATLASIASFIGSTAPTKWLAEAATLVDGGRVHCQAENIPQDDLDMQHRDLLNELGYQ